MVCRVSYSTYRVSYTPQDKNPEQNNPYFRLRNPILVARSEDEGMKETAIGAVVMDYTLPDLEHKPYPALRYREEGAGK